MCPQAVYSFRGVQRELLRQRLKTPALHTIVSDRVDDADVAVAVKIAGHER